MALRASAKGGIEAEAARLQFGHIEAAIGAGHGSGEQLLLAAGDGHQHQAIGQLQRLGHGRVEALFGGGLAGGERRCRRNRRGNRRILQQDAVDHSFDGMVFAAVERNRLGEVHDLAVHARPEALPVELVEHLLEFALAPAHNGRHHGDALAEAEFENALHNLIRSLAGDGPAAVGAVRRAHRCVEQAQVIVNFRDRSHGRAGAAAGRFLLDGDGRAESLNRVHVGPLDLVEELPRVSRQRLYVAPLPLGIDRVEGKRALARAAEARDHRERVARDAHVDVAQIVLARPAHRDVCDGHDESQ